MYLSRMKNIPSHAHKILMVSRNRIPSEVWQIFEAFILIINHGRILLTHNLSKPATWLNTCMSPQFWQSNPIWLQKKIINKIINKIIICLDIFLKTLTVPLGSQFFPSFALRKLLTPHVEWRLLFVVSIWHLNMRRYSKQQINKTGSKEPTM